MAYDTDEAAAKRHDGHASGNALHQHIFNRRERELQVRLQQLEDGIAHQAGRHRHDGHPARLEAEVHVGTAYHGADAQASSDTAHGEAVALGRWRGHGFIASAVPAVLKVFGLFDGQFSESAESFAECLARVTVLVFSLLASLSR